MRFLFLVLLAVFTVSAHAQDAGSRYEVTGVNINMPTDNATTARDTALTEATKQAYAQLKDRLAAEGEILPTLSDSAMASAVQDFSVDGEKISAKRYIGSFTIRFRPTVASAVPATESGQPVAATGEGITQIPATFAFGQLSEWVTGRAALRNTNGIRGIQIAGLRRNYVDVNLRYAGGDAGAFAQALAAQGISASAPTATNPRWFLRLQQQ